MRARAYNHESSIERRILDVTARLTDVRIGTPLLMSHAADAQCAMRAATAVHTKNTVRAMVGARVDGVARWRVADAREGGLDVDYPLWRMRSRAWNDDDDAIARGVGCVRGVRVALRVCEGSY